MHNKGIKVHKCFSCIKENVLNFKKKCFIDDLIFCYFQANENNQFLKEDVFNLLVFLIFNF